VRGEAAGTRDDTRAALLALISGHMPEVRWDDDERVGRIACSCGRGLYVGHLVTLIVNRLHGEEMAEWERELLEREARHLRAVDLTAAADQEASGDGEGASES
jgi:hypothetical protein